ncbi:hypothetical protein L3X38_036042 [Prunus dulcis]|uniref:Uncharacterized protein n=1 Tax=Prunus dulcis TaxID=3755 RepID=A0AAD4V0H6_PRUDU|nr:hypothetical protein L3X38_036042 [Prunus dulcis]
MGSTRTSLIFRNLSLPYILNNPNIDLQKSMVEELRLDYCASSLATLPRPHHPPFHIVSFPPLSLAYTIQSFLSLTSGQTLSDFQSSGSYLEKLVVGQMTNLGHLQ